MIYNFDELSFQVLSINRFTHEPGFFSVAPRPFSALSLRLSGSGDFQVGALHFTSRPGDILFIPQGTGYKVEYSPSESIVIHLADCNYTASENITSPGSGIFLSKFEELESYWGTFHSHNGAKAMIYNILQRISESKSVPESDMDFLKCVSFIDENFSNPDIDIAQICAECFISESGLRRKFHAYYGMSPKRYLLKLRLGKAIDLLTSGAFSVKAVSEMCGFSDEKYFSRAVKSKYGQPPSTFKNCKNG